MNMFPIGSMAFGGYPRYSIKVRRHGWSMELNTFIKVYVCEVNVYVCEVQVFA